MKLPIYLDYSSTTPVDKRVIKKMIQYLSIDGNFGNASSKFHLFGWRAAEAVDIARNHIAHLIGSDILEIIFTSGATESNNLVIKGLLNNFKNEKKHIITSNIEHKSILNTCFFLEKCGFSITYLNCDSNGLIKIKDLKNAIKKNTILVSIIHVNNEIGCIQNIECISKICKKNNILFHIDATQSIGKIPINVKKNNINFMSFSAHKIYGPKGIGVLYIQNNLKKKLQIQIHGGSQEFGIRSGTLPVHQIIAMGEACKIIKKEMFLETIRIKKLQKIFLKGLKEIDLLDNINNNINYSIPNILNIRFNNTNNKKFAILLKNLAVSYGAACNSYYNEPSYVLKSLGLSDSSAKNSIRFSIGRFTTEEEIYFTINLLKKVL